MTLKSSIYVSTWHFNAESREWGDENLLMKYHSRGPVWAPYYSVPGQEISWCKEQLEDDKEPSQKLTSFLIHSNYTHWRDTEWHKITPYLCSSELRVNLTRFATNSISFLWCLWPARAKLSQLLYRSAPTTELQLLDSEVAQRLRSLVPCRERMAEGQCKPAISKLPFQEGTPRSRSRAEMTEKGLRTCVVCGHTFPPVLLDYNSTPATNQSTLRLQLSGWHEQTLCKRLSSSTNTNGTHMCKSKTDAFAINFIFTEAAKSQLAPPTTPQGGQWIWLQIQRGLIKGCLGSRTQHLVPNLPIPYPCSHLYSTKFSSDGGGGHSPCRFSHNLNSSVHSPSLVQRIGT